MSARPALQPRVGDLTVVSGRVAEVTKVYPPEHAFGGGGLLVRFVDAPRTLAVVRTAELTMLGFGDTVRAPEVSS